MKKPLLISLLLEVCAVAQVLRPPTVTPSTPLTPNRVVITDSAGRLTTISGTLTNCVLGNATLSACGGSGGVSDGDKGDIVVSGTGTVYSIDTGVIVNAQINASAAIALSKLAALTASRVLVSDGSGVVSVSSVTTTTLGYLDATSSIQTQLNGKQASLGFTPANSTVTLTAGTGLSGGGDLSTNRTFTLSINGGSAQTCTGTDKVSAISAVGIVTCSADQTGGGGVSDGDKGDITVSSSGTVWTIDNSAVTLAKIANIADQRILGNVSGGSAAPAELTASSVKTMLAYAFSDISGSVTDSQVPNNITIDLATAATALAANGANCSAGQLPRGVDASGAAEGCAAVSLTADVSGTLPVANGGTGITSLGTGVATWLGTPSSANLAAALTDETGSGAAVFGTAPTLTTPVISAYTVGTLPAASAGQLAVVTDAASAGSCTSGGGSALSLCRYNGSAWVAVGDGGSGGGGGITSLGVSGSGQTGATQTLATGTSGTDFNITSSSNTHTFNIPDASSSNRGLVTTGTQGFMGQKTFNGPASSSDPVVVIDEPNTSTGGPLILKRSGSTLFKVTFTGDFEMGGNLSTAFGSSLTLAPLYSSSDTRDGIILGNASSANTTGHNDFVAVRQTFNPSSGSGTFASLGIQTTMNQTGTATGPARGLYLNPTITSVYDYRFLDMAATTVNVLSGSPDQNAVLLNAATYAAAASKTLSNVATIKVGEPVAGTNVTITNRYSGWFLGSIRTDKRIQNGVTTVSYSATPTFDMSTGDQLITLTGNVTSSTASNLVAGQRVTFFICQDGTGGRTFAWPTNMKGVTTIGGTASTCSVQQFESPDGTNLYALGAGVTNQ